MNSKHILILGAGRSSTALIQYLLQQALLYQWKVTVGDFSEEAARQRVAGSAGQAIRFDIQQQDMSEMAIAQADVVVSLLPAHLHVLVAKICLALGKYLLTASYVSDEMKQFDTAAKEKNILFLNECGLDPGIDHMSAMQVIDRIRERGGQMVSFESFTGGLIAPETDPQNPWRYKFTWNPRNVVMAGQGTAKFLKDGAYKFIPYQQLFQRITPVSVPGFGEYEGYANRDSLKYLETYGLTGIKTMLRGTLRNKGYCPAWNILVQLGCCDDTYPMEGVEQMTHRQFLSAFLSGGDDVRQQIATQFDVPLHGEELTRLSWSGLFSDEPIGLQQGSPAQVLEHILNKKWKLASGDKDFIVMWHRFVYRHHGELHETQAYLTATGDNEVQTAMAKTVGLPLAIATKLLLLGKISSRGVVIPVGKELYDPILEELHQLGISLLEKEIK